MNILYIDHYAGSKKRGRSFRPFYLGQEWQKQGHQLTVVGGTYSHLRQKNPKPGIEEEDGIRYLWLWTPRYKGNGLGRIFSMIVFTVQLFLHIPKIIKLSQPDCIIASTVYMLDIFPAWVMKKWLRKKPQLIFELHDLWPLSPQQIGKMSAWNPYILFLGWVEKCVYRLCDKVVSILPNTFSHIKKFGMRQKNFFHVPNGIVLEDWQKAESGYGDDSLKNHLTFLQGLKKQNRFLVGYVGTHSCSNALENFIDAATYLADTPVHLILVGAGNEKSLLQQEVVRRGLKNVSFLDSVPKSCVPALLKQFDALYTGLYDLPLYQYGVSLNKMFDYMMAARPVVAALNSPKNPIALSGCGFEVPPMNAKALAKILIRASKTPEKERSLMGQKGRAFVLKHHTYDQLAKIFLDVF